MKRLFFFLFLSVLPNVKAQDYLPILEEDTVWSVYIYNFFNGSAGIVQITVGENIIIGGNSYKTVFFDGTSTSCLL